MDYTKGTGGVNRDSLSSNDSSVSGAEGLEDLLNPTEPREQRTAAAPADDGLVMRRDPKTGTRTWQSVPKPVPASQTDAASKVRASVDGGMAGRFVELLTGSPDTALSWRFLPERGTAEERRILDLEKAKRVETHNKRWAVQRNYDGTVAEVLGDIKEHQAMRWGIFAVVNEGGRKAIDIRHVRSLFIDMDGRDLETIRFHAEPDFIVQRDGDHWHAYWLASDCPLDRFREVQLRLAHHYQSDLAVCDLPRVLRIPGTRHYKDPEHPRDMVLHERRRGPPRPLAEIMRGIAELPAEEKGGRVPSGAVGDPVSEANLIDLLRHIDPDVPYPGWRDIVAAIGATNLVGDETSERRREIADAWSAGEFWDKPVSRYDCPEAVSQVMDTMPPREGGVGFGTIVHAAKAGGYRAEPPRPDFGTTFSGIQQQQRNSGLIVLRGDEIEPQTIDWVWSGYLARRQLHILAGAGGSGKSTILTDFAATITAGGRWPDGSIAVPGSVLIWEGEDLIRQTTHPRFLAARGDPTRVNFVEGVRNENGETVYFDPASHLPHLRAFAANMTDLALIVISPLASIVTGNGDKNNEVRRALAPLLAIAEDFNVPVVAIHHYTKGTQGRAPLERVSMSLAFGAVARVVLGTAVSEEDGDKRRLVRIKSNIGPQGGGFDFRLEQQRIDANVSGQRVVWGSAVFGPAQRLIAELEDGVNRKPPPPAVLTAMNFLQSFLAAGPKPKDEIDEHARGHGITPGTLRRAKEEMGIEIKHGPEFGGAWFWSLPRYDDKPGDGPMPL